MPKPGGHEPNCVGPGHAPSSVGPAGTKGAKAPKVAKARPSWPPHTPQRVPLPCVGVALETSVGRREDA